jgi:hypothetical protein
VQKEPTMQWKATRIGRAVLWAAFVLVLILGAIVAASVAHAQPTAWFDWTNAVARPVGEAGGYTLEEARAARGADLYCWTARAVFTDTGHAQALELAGASPVLVYVSVQHVRLADYYAASPWPWYQALGPVEAGTVAYNAAGQPAVRWRGTDRSQDSYHQDARLADPGALVAVLREFVDRYPVGGVFLDYLATKPWTYPDDPPLLEEAVGGLDLWRSYQVRLVWELRREFGPDFLLIANGPWPVEQPLLTQPALLSGVYFERCGTLWWTVPQVVALLEQHAAQGGLLLFGGKRGGKSGTWDMPQVAQLLALTTPGGYVGIGPRFDYQLRR